MSKIDYAVGTRSHGSIVPDAFVTIIYRRKGVAFEKVGGAKSVTKELEKELGKELEKELAIREKDILNLISKNTKITQKELSEKIGISPQNIRKYIAKLKTKGILSRIGPDKGGYWKIKE